MSSDAAADDPCRRPVGSSAIRPVNEPEGLARSRLLSSAARTGSWAETEEEEDPGGEVKCGMRPAGQDGWRGVGASGA